MAPSSAYTASASFHLYVRRFLLLAVKSFKYLLKHSKFTLQISSFKVYEIIYSVGVFTPRRSRRETAP
jgi:hypothetical protein